MLRSNPGTGTKCLTHFFKNRFETFSSCFQSNSGLESVFQPCHADEEVLYIFSSDGSSLRWHFGTGPCGNWIPLPIMKSFTGLSPDLMVQGSVGSLVNFLTPRTTAAHWPSSRVTGMLCVFCFNIPNTHGVESSFAYYRMITSLAFYLPILL